MANRYLVLLKFWVNLKSLLNFEFKGKKNLTQSPTRQCHWERENSKKSYLKSSSYTETREFAKNPNEQLRKRETRPVLSSFKFSEHSLIVGSASNLIARYSRSLLRPEPQYSKCFFLVSML